MVPDLYTSQIVRNEIKNADAVIAIATPRNYDQISSTWRTLEWLQSEVGIGCGINKPLLLIKEKTVKLEGLPSYLSTFENIPLIEFDKNYPGDHRSFRLLYALLQTSYKEEKNR